MKYDLIVLESRPRSYVIYAKKQEQYKKIITQQ